MNDITQAIGEIASGMDDRDLGRAIDGVVRSRE